MSGHSRSCALLVTRSTFRPGNISIRQKPRALRFPSRRPAQSMISSSRRSASPGLIAATPLRTLSTAHFWRSPATAVRRSRETSVWQNASSTPTFGLKCRRQRLVGMARCYRSGQTNEEAAHCSSLLQGTSRSNGLSPPGPGIPWGGAVHTCSKPACFFRSTSLSQA